MKPATASKPSAPPAARSWARAMDSLGMLLIFVVLFVVCSLTVDNFRSMGNLIGLALSVSMVGMVACTMLFCMASGDFDLSVEAMVAFAGVLTAVVINLVSLGGTLAPHIGGWTLFHLTIAPHPGMVAVLIGALCGVVGCGIVGAINGFVIAKVGINALITTLATMQIVRGLGFIVSNGSAVGITEPSFFQMGLSHPMGVPTPIWITVACFLVFGVLIHRTAFGRHTLAIGGNMEAARLSGVPVQRVRIIIFTLQGLMAGFAGVILASRLTSGQPNTSVGFSLDVISACVLGGVSLSGGVGTMLGVVVGVLIMGTVQNAMNLMNVPTFWQYVARGLILLAAVIFDRWRRSRA